MQNHDTNINVTPGIGYYSSIRDELILQCRSGTQLKLIDHWNKSATVLGKVPNDVSSDRNWSGVCLFRFKGGERLIMVSLSSSTSVIEQVMHCVPPVLAICSQV